MTARALFVGGTSSNAGKSWMATAICAWLRRKGVAVAPFKAQNMSNHSYPCTGGGEIGRAQVAQAEPVVDALYDWSGFARRGTWGQLTSSWAAQFTGLCETPDDQRSVQPVIEAFFQGSDVVAIMQPRMHAVTHGPATHLYQRRASCCRWYLLPHGELCASCPLVSHEERLERNRAWMEKQAERQRSTRSGHA